MSFQVDKAYTTYNQFAKLTSQEIWFVTRGRGNADFHVTKVIVDKTRKRNAWIGAAAIILPGVTIGENSIVAGVVVSKDVPADTILGGVSAKHLKNI